MPASVVAGPIGGGVTGQGLVGLTLDEEPSLAVHLVGQVGLVSLLHVSKFMADFPLDLGEVDIHIRLDVGE